MDAIYYITGILMMLGIPALLILLTTYILKPHIAAKHLNHNNPISRKKITSIGTVSLFVAMMSFGSVLAATEPASVKADQAAREASEAKSLQVQLETRKKQEAENAREQAAEETRKREEELNKPVTKSETKIEVVSFESIERNDNTIPSGERRVSVAGVNGERSISYNVTYTRGIETARNEVTNVISKPPISEVILNGTYVKPAPTAPTQSASCPNGTYVNSTGNSVCRPYQSSGAPAGASAQCSDGTYSFSQSRRGTCSGHGGVASWL